MARRGMMWGVCVRVETNKRMCEFFTPAFFLSLFHLFLAGATPTAAFFLAAAAPPPSIAATARLAPPFAAVSTALTRSANRSEHSVSPADAASGATLTNISVLPVPPKHGSSSLVSLELR